MINNSNDTKSSYNFISSNIEINLDEIVNKLNIPINKFSLIGKIKKGEFVKILSKSQFYDGNFLDISLNSDLINKKKVLEIYSDQAKPILSDFSFIIIKNFIFLVFTKSYYIFSVTNWIKFNKKDWLPLS